jgi:uncharacterized protein (TIGR02996 family)
MIQTLLEHLRELVEQRDFSKALPVALQSWQRAPDPELARVIAKIADLLQRPAKKTAINAKRMLSEADPSTLPDVLWWVFFDSANSPAMQRRLEQLEAAWPEDPRITDCLFSFFAEPRWDLCGPNPKALAAYIVELLAKSRDPRVDAWVRQLPAFFEAHRGTRRGQLSKDEIAVLDELFRGAGLIPGRGKAAHEPITLDAEHVAFVAEVLSVLEKAEAQREQQALAGERLLQAVIDEWDCDAPKLVYADWLQERGDPQGELIALALDSSPKSPAIEGRIRQLEEIVKGTLGVPAKVWQKGFPREVSVWTDAGPTHHYGEQQAWGTVVSVDIPPKRDTCHTENLRRLRVAVSYLGALKELEKPLAVTCFGIINPSARARAALKKITVLAQVKTLELIHAAADDLDWLFAVPWLAKIEQLTFVSFSRYNLARLVQAGRRILDELSTLQSVLFFPSDDNKQLRLQLFRHQKKGGLRLVITAKDDQQVALVQQAFADVPRPSFDVLELRTPAIDLDGLQGLGRTLQVTRIAAGPLAQVTLGEDGVVVVSPARGQRSIDVTNFTMALEAWQGPRGKLRAEALQLQWLSRYLSRAAQLGFEELWLSGWADHASIAVHRTADGWLELSQPHYSVPKPIFTVPEAKLRLRCNPAIDLEQLAQTCRERGCSEVETVADEAVRAGLFRVKYVKKTRRLELDAGFSSCLAIVPATVELLRSGFIEQLPNAKRAKHPIDEIRVRAQNFRFDETLAEWLDWSESQGCAVVFQSNRDEITRLQASADGLTGALYLQHLSSYLQTWPELLSSLPKGRFTELTVQSRRPIEAEIQEALGSIARRLQLRAD